MGWVHGHGRQQVGDDGGAVVAAAGVIVICDIAHDIPPLPSFAYTTTTTSYHLPLIPLLALVPPVNYE